MPVGHPAPFPAHRPRRLRLTPAMRELVGGMGCSLVLFGSLWLPRFTTSEDNRFSRLGGASGGDGVASGSAAEVLRVGCRLEGLNRHAGILCDLTVTRLGRLARRLVADGIAANVAGISYDPGFDRPEHPLALVGERLEKVTALPEPQLAVGAGEDPERAPVEEGLPEPTLGRQVALDEICGAVGGRHEEGVQLTNQVLGPDDPRTAQYRKALTTRLF